MPATQRMAETLGCADGAARRGDPREAMVVLAALERDAGGSAEALAHHALDDLEETRRAIDDAGGDED
ncbi:hypothetical protein GBA65_09675 [Rubrobacter marinus]|uniref:Uncharacterized protein n=1 Tax=Rubrobacter marinus TaxID=2653852 RepID=A0A6G8PX24_9ACTN|nr:hypothetical protein [Rubrobacter marinus]QIN78746.1 hypothetical protein GBA65_09675 [Rubrobacter marinus]